MNRCRTTIAAVVFATTLSAIAYGGDKMSVRAPPASMDHRERTLTSSEIAKSPCTSLARGLAEGYEGIDMNSESVSIDGDFGNIYRYRIFRSIEHQGTIHRVETVLVVWSKNCDTAELATYPTFQFSGGTQQP